MRRLAVWLLLGWTLVAGLYLAQRDSLTTDEGIHVASGYLILTRGDWRFDPEHPPLMKILSALPLLSIHPYLPAGDQQLWAAAKPTLDDSWETTREWTDRWFYRSGNNADLMIFLMRIPTVLLLTTLGYVSFKLAKEWFSEKVGLWTLFLVTFNPTLLAHGHLANDDVAVALGVLAALFWLRRWYKNPLPQQAALVGAMLGLAIGLKFSGLIALIPAGAVLAVALYKKIPGTWMSAIIASFVLCGCIWVMYGFQSPLSHGSALQEANFVHNQGISLSAASLYALLEHVRYFLPTLFLRGIALVHSSTVTGRGAYILSHHYSPAIWFYFPVLFLLKTQLVALVVGAWGFISLPWRRLQLYKIEQWLLVLTIIIISLSAVLNKLDLGIRHIATLLPLLSIALACLLASWRVSATAVFVPLYVLPLLIQWPYPIGFTNAVVQPYQDGWRYMDGSNLDWGQQAKESAQLLNQLYPGRTVATNYYWNPYALSYYGVKTEPLDPMILPVGEPILITASILTDDKLVQLRQLKPVATIANSTFIYYIQP